MNSISDSGVELSLRVSMAEALSSAEAEELASRSRALGLTRGELAARFIRDGLNISRAQEEGLLAAKVQESAKRAVPARSRRSPFETFEKALAAEHKASPSRYRVRRDVDGREALEVHVDPRITQKAAGIAAETGTTTARVLENWIKDELARLETQRKEVAP